MYEQLLTALLYLLTGFTLAWLVQSARVNRAEAKADNAVCNAINAQKRERIVQQKYDDLVYQLEEKSNLTMRALREINNFNQVMHGSHVGQRKRESIQVICQ